MTNTLSNLWQKLNMDEWMNEWINEWIKQKQIFLTYLNLDDLDEQNHKILEY